MFKSKYYLPYHFASQSYLNEDRMEKFVYDTDVDELGNGIILPLRRCLDHNPGISEGGVCDHNFKFIAGYSRSTNKNRIKTQGCVIRSYQTAVNKTLDETVVYGDIICNHFGHFLMDSFSRLWYAVKHKNENLRYAFIASGNFELQDYHVKLLGFLGIDESRLLIIKEPTQFKRIIIPKQAWYTASGYNTELFNYVWDEIRSKITPKKFKKVYLSRSKYKYHDIFGEEFFENFFGSHGFKIIYPELLPIEDQVAYISGADEVACIYGTLAHHALFAKDGTKFIFLLRYSMPVGAQFQSYIHSAKNIDFAYIDTALTIFPNFHASYAGYLIGPTAYWNNFLYKEYGIENQTDIFSFLDSTNIKLGSYIKLFIEKMATDTNFLNIYAYRFDYAKYLKNLYSSYALSDFPKMQSAMKINTSPFFKEKLFTYKKSQNKQKYIVKLLKDGQIWPINHGLAGERFWSFYKGRLYF